MVNLDNKSFEKAIRLGILKGGQLGRMLLTPCMDLGVVPHIMDNDPSAPAKIFCSNFVVGDAQNFDDVYNFGKNLDVITLEIEHIHLEALKKLKEHGVKVNPSPELIEIVQDKGKQKQFYQDNGFPTAPFFCAVNQKDLTKQIKQFPLIQKLRKDGYDGRGVTALTSYEDVIAKSFDAPSVVEEMVEIAHEISVLVARNERGDLATYPVVEMVVNQDTNMLDYLVSPARVDENQAQAAQKSAQMLAKKINLVGIMAVEMFITKDNQILINEIAPRPHNSGHHTIEACTTSQFEQHLRAVLNLPLGATTMTRPSATINLVGASGHEGPAVYEGLDPFLSMPDVYVHIYGKKFTRPNRKMGHITVIRDTVEEVVNTIIQIKREVRVISCPNQ